MPWTTREEMLARVRADKARTEPLLKEAEAFAAAQRGLLARAEEALREVRRQWDELNKAEDGLLVMEPGTGAFVPEREGGRGGH